MAIIAQGAFTQGATATAQTLRVPSNLDSLEVINVTQSGTSAAPGPNGVYFYWQRPSTNSSGVVVGIDATGTKGTYWAAATGTQAMTSGVTAANAFVLYDPASDTWSSLNNGSTGVSDLTAASPAVATVGSTTGLATGNIVRLFSLNGAQQNIYNGIDFTATLANATTFNLAYLDSTGTTASTTGSWRWKAYNPLFYPGRRTITGISSAAQAVVKLSVTHNFSVGQAVRLEFPGGSDVWGSYAAFVADPNRAYTVVAVSAANNTITLDMDTSSFGANDFRTQWESVTYPYSPAQVVPIGENTAVALANGTNILADATYNSGYLGITLSAGALLPAGAANDTIVWRAIKADVGGL